jgi:hypothetical protein
MAPYSRVVAGTKGGELSEHTASWMRVLLAASLLVNAVLWPFLEWESFPHGPVLYAVAPAEGLVTSDLLALIPLALAIFVMRPLLRRQPR